MNKLDLMRDFLVSLLSDLLFKFLIKKALYMTPLLIL